MQFWKLSIPASQLLQTHEIASKQTTIEIPPATNFAEVTRITTPHAGIPKKQVWTFRDEKSGNTRSANLHRGQEIRRKMDGKTGGDRVKCCQKTTQTTTRCPIATDHPIASNPKNTH